MAIRDLYHDAETIARHQRDGGWADRTLDAQRVGQKALIR